MAYSKKESFSDEEIEMAKIAKALGHPARLAILRLLASQCQCYCGSLTDELPLSQSTISQHLKELKNAGLIQGEITAPKIRYCINHENWKKAKEMFSELFIESKHDC